jgi:hypothetical protein
LEQESFLERFLLSSTQRVNTEVSRGDCHNNEIATRREKHSALLGKMSKKGEAKIEGN